MSTQPMPPRPMPTRTRLATFVVALAATAIGTVTPAASDSGPAGPPAGDRAVPGGIVSR